MKRLILYLFYLIVIKPNLVYSQSIITGDTLFPGINYYNIPDTLLHVMPNNQDTLLIDIDFNGANDLMYTSRLLVSPGNTYSDQKVFALNGFQLVDRTGSSGYVDTSTVGSIIDSSLNWVNALNGLTMRNYYYSGGSYNIIGTFIKPKLYMAFRKQTFMDTIYGWVFIDRASFGDVEILSWGYLHKINGVIGERDLSDNFLIYPNPATESIKIEAESTAIDKIRIYNSIGELIYNEEMLRGNNRIVLNIENLNSGLYYVVIEQGGNRIQKKLFKQ